MSVTSLGRWLRRSDATAPSVLPAPTSPAAAQSTSVDDAVVGRLIDVAGALLQVAGAYAHDTDTRSADEAKQDAEKWRKHLTLGFDHPTDDATRRGGAVAERDWDGAVRYAVGDRRAEHAYVSRTTTELRDTIWTLIQGLHRVSDAESEAGRESAATLDRLRTRVAEADASAMRDVALSAFTEMARQITVRDRERDQQLVALGKEVATLGAALDEAKREGATDSMTGLGNRRAFDSAVEHAIALHGLWRQQMCLVLLDLDGLKAINDTLGHAAGDTAIIAASGQLSRIFLRRTDVLARIGGDEFAVLLRDTTEDEAMRMTTRVAALVAATPVAPPPSENADDDERDDATEPVAPPALGISAGVALLRAGESGAQWVARADAALYAAKRGGRGRVERAES